MILTHPGWLSVMVRVTWSVDTPVAISEDWWLANRIGLCGETLALHLGQAYLKTDIRRVQI